MRFITLESCATAAAAMDVPTFVRDLRGLSDVERGECAEYVQECRKYVNVGDVVHVITPYSECAMSMGIAGLRRAYRVCECGVRLQVWTRQGFMNDGPHMTDGEAGILCDCDGRYCYDVHAC